MYRKPSATVGAMFVISLTLLLFLLNGDETVLAWVWNGLGPYEGFIQLMMAYVVIACFGAFAMRSEGISWGDLGLSKNNLLLALPLFAAFLIGNSVLVFLDGGWSHAFIGSTASLPLWTAVVGVAVVSLSEEFVFRGFVQIGTTRRFGVTYGIIVSAAVFSLAHIPTDLAGLNPSSGVIAAVSTLAGAAIVRFAFGALTFSYIYDLTGNLFITVLTHAFYDFSLTYLVVAGGAFTFILLYIGVPLVIVFAVYSASPFQGLMPHAPVPVTPEEHPVVRQGN